jgi:hypothetical protein
MWGGIWYKGGCYYSQKLLCTSEYLADLEYTAHEGEEPFRVLVGGQGTDLVPGVFEGLECALQELEGRELD